MTLAFIAHDHSGNTGAGNNETFVAASIGTAPATDGDIIAFLTWRSESGLATWVSASIAGVAATTLGWNTKIGTGSLGWGWALVKASMATVNAADTTGDISMNTSGGGGVTRHGLATWESDIALNLVSGGLHDLGTTTNGGVSDTAHALSVTSAAGGWAICGTTSFSNGGTDVTFSTFTQRFDDSCFGSTQHAGADSNGTTAGGTLNQTATFVNSWGAPQAVLAAFEAAGGGGSSIAAIQNHYSRTRGRIFTRHAPPGFGRRNTGLLVPARYKEAA